MVPRDVAAGDDGCRQTKGAIAGRTDAGELERNDRRRSRKVSRRDARAWQRCDNGARRSWWDVGVMKSGVRRGRQCDAPLRQE